MEPNLRWGGESARKWIRVQAFSHFRIGRWIGAAFVEDGNADHAHVARVVMLLSCIRLPHRTKSKRGYGIGVLPESVDNQLAAWRQNIAGFAQGALPTIQNVKPID